MKKKGTAINDIHRLCAGIPEAVMKYSLKNSLHKVCVIFIAFKNFENKMKDPDFEYHHQTKCEELSENYDFSEM